MNTFQIIVRAIYAEYSIYPYNELNNTKIIYGPFDSQLHFKYYYGNEKDCYITVDFKRIITYISKIIDGSNSNNLDLSSDEKTVVNDIYDIVIKLYNKYIMENYLG